MKAVIQLVSKASVTVEQKEKREIGPGYVILLGVAEGDTEEIMKKIQRRNPLFAEAIPLTLEEIFISETEVAGYDIKKLFA